MKSLEQRAFEFANFHHTSVLQRRKYTGEPYIVHPAAVANKVRGVPGCTEEMLAAAWLHDTVEDTRATFADIFDQFGEQVASYVNYLTNCPLSAGNREARNRLDRDRLARAPGEVQTIKLADLIDNTDSITKHDKGFARIYMVEKAMLLDVLTKGDPTLLAEARGIVNAWVTGET
jgi:(p)ppGpp synthase/HD superfamily hydrolase